MNSQHIVLDQLADIHQRIFVAMSFNCFSSFSNSKDPSTTNPPPSHSSCSLWIFLRQSKPTAASSLLALRLMRSRHTSGEVRRYMGRWSSLRSANFHKSSYTLWYISNSIGVSCPSYLVSRAKMILSAAILLSVNRGARGPVKSRVRSILDSWLTRVRRAQVWKEYAHREGSRQYASRMLCGPMRCHQPMGSGESIMLGM